MKRTSSSNNGDVSLNTILCCCPPTVQLSAVLMQLQAWSVWLYSRLRGLWLELLPSRLHLKIKTNTSFNVHIIQLAEQHIHQWKRLKLWRSWAGLPHIHMLITSLSLPLNVYIRQRKHQTSWCRLANTNMDLLENYLIIIFVNFRKKIMSYLLV